MIHFTRTGCLLLCLAVTALSMHALAPSIQWQKTFGGSDFDQGLSVIQTTDGGFMAAGIATSTNGDVGSNHGFGDVWLVKINALGQLQWEKALGGSADDGAFDVVQTPDG